MVVLEKLRDSYASADFATLFLEAVIRKAGIDDMVRGYRERLRKENPRAVLSMDMVNEIRNRSKAGRWTPHLSADTGIEPELYGSHTVTIPIHGNELGNLPITISARTPDSEDAAPYDQLSKTNLEFTAGTDTDIDLNDFLTFNNSNET
jgi:hypothetical protein